MNDEPWLKWSDGKFKPYGGTSVETQERVAWMVKNVTGLVPVNGEWKHWGAGCAQVYEAGGGDWHAIERGIREAWNREPQYRPGHVRGFVNAVRKAHAGGSGVRVGW